MPPWEVQDISQSKYLYSTLICTVSPNCQREKQTERKIVPSLELLNSAKYQKDKIKCLHKHSQNNPSTNEHHIVQLFLSSVSHLGPIRIVQKNLLLSRGKGDLQYADH